jgi:hypothetical protein
MAPRRRLLMVAGIAAAFAWRERMLRKNERLFGMGSGTGARSR